MEDDDQRGSLREPVESRRGPGGDVLFSGQIAVTPTNEAYGRSRTSGSKHDNDVPLFVAILTISASLGGFLFGYDTGVISGAAILITDEFHLSSTQEEIIVSVTIASAAASSFVGGPLMQYWGRRPVIILSGVIFTLGAILLAVAMSYVDLVFGRFVLGIGIGLASLASPVYIAEAAPSHFRGKLVTLNTLFITGGQVIAGVVDGIFSTTTGGWRHMLGLSAVPAVLMTLAFMFLPESPRWLVAAGRQKKALTTLQQIRGTPDVHAELEEIVESSTDNTGVDGEAKLKRGATVRELLQEPKIRRALVLGCGLQLLQQLCGINTLMYYSSTVCSMAGFGDEISIWLSAVTAAAQSAGVCLGIIFIERFGRRILVLTSLALVIVSLISLGVGFVLYDASSSDEVYGWFVVLCMMFYLFTFGFGMSPVPWAVNADVYPNHARSLGTSASTTVNWLGNCLVSATFLTLVDSSLGKAGTFWLYAVIGTVGWLWLHSIMPETKGVSLEEVGRLFAREWDPLPSVEPGGLREGDVRGQTGLSTPTNPESNPGGGVFLNRSHLRHSNGFAVL